MALAFVKTHYMLIQAIRTDKVEFLRDRVIFLKVSFITRKYNLQLDILFKKILSNCILRGYISIILLIIFRQSYSLNQK